MGRPGNGDDGGGAVGGRCGGGGGVEAGGAEDSGGCCGGGGGHRPEGYDGPSDRWANPARAWPLKCGVADS